MQKVHLLLWGVALLGITACGPKYYIPNTQNMPLFTHKGEKNFNFSANLGQAELMSAMAVGNNTGVMLNASKFGAGPSGFMEIGLGHFHVNDKNWIFETYGLAGIGTIEYRYQNDDIVGPLLFWPILFTENGKGSMRARTTRFAVQQNIGFKGKNISNSFSLRAGVLNYSNIKGDLQINDRNEVRYLKSHDSQVLFEPAYTVKFGSDQINFQTQVGASFNLTQASFPQRNFWFTAGMNLRFR
jgi:hypothetical protein